MEIKQHLKLSQQLVMTPQLQQAIKLLQLSRMELVDMVRDEMLENPILEDSVESGAEQPKTAEEPIQANSEGEVERVGETETPIQEMPVERQEASEAVLTRVQEFDPVGVAARSLEECLMIQARHVGADDEVVVGILQRHLPNLEKKNYQAIAKDLNQPLDEIYEAAKVVMGFDPK